MTRKMEYENIRCTRALCYHYYRFLLLDATDTRSYNNIHNTWLCVGVSMKLVYAGGGYIASAWKNRELDQMSLMASYNFSF